jgi:hypothetical protein
LYTTALDVLYKSSDAAGNVTYSDTPPVNATHVQDIEVPEGPRAEETQQAVERSEQMSQ